MITASPLTWTAEDSPLSEEEETPELVQCTEAEVSEALATATLTPEHCLWLHENKVNWHIEVQ